MSKFEYKELKYNVQYRVFKNPHHLVLGEYIKDLNDEGKKGWELVNTFKNGTSDTNSEIVFLLKKEISSDKSYFQK